MCRNSAYFQEERKVSSGIPSLCLHSFTGQPSPCKLWYHLSRINVLAWSSKEVIIEVGVSPNVAQTCGL